MMPSHVAIVNFTGFHANWGCQATSWELLKFVVGCFDSLPKISLIPQLPHCDLDVELTGRLGEICSAMDAVLEGSSQANAQLRLLERLCLDRCGFWADQVRQADFVIFQGEGTMSGIPDFRHSAGLLLLPFIAKHAWGKPVVAINQTIFGGDTKFLATAARIFRSLNFVAVREAASLQFAQSLGLEACNYIPDTAFLTRAFPDPRLPTLNRSNRYFCVTGSALSLPSVDEFIFSCADRLRSETGMIPVLAAPKDKGLRQLARRHWPPGSYDTIPSEVSYPAVAHVLSKCEFILGGRYHMAIMAAAVATPSILLRGNTFKNEGLAAAIGVGLPLPDIGDTAEVISRASHLIASLDRVRAKLRAAAASITSELYRGRTTLRDVLAQRYPHTVAAAPRLNVTQDLVKYYASAARAKSDLIREKAERRRKIGAHERFGSRPSLVEARRFLVAAHQGDMASTESVLSSIATCHSQTAIGNNLWRVGAAIRKLSPAPLRIMRSRKHP